MKNKKVVVAGVLLSKACALSENHLLSEALSPLSELGESGGESVKHQRTQRVISSLSESFVFSRTKRAQLALWKSTNSRLAQKWSYVSLRGQKAL